jgi:hypothetical protein
MSRLQTNRRASRKFRVWLRKHIWTLLCLIGGKQPTPMPDRSFGMTAARRIALNIAKLPELLKKQGPLFGRELALSLSLPPHAAAHSIGAA